MLISTEKGLPPESPLLFPHHCTPAFFAATGSIFLSVSPAALAPPRSLSLTAITSAGTAAFAAGRIAWAEPSLTSRLPRPLRRGRCHQGLRRRGGGPSPPCYRGVRASKRAGLRGGLPGACREDDGEEGGETGLHAGAAVDEPVTSARACRPPTPPRACCGKSKSIDPREMGRGGKLLSDVHSPITITAVTTVAPENCSLGGDRRSCDKACRHVQNATELSVCRAWDRLSRTGRPGGHAVKLAFGTDHTSCGRIDDWHVRPHGRGFFWRFTSRARFSLPT